MKNHPDKLLHSGIDEETANAMFSRVRDAFDTLSNPTSKVRPTTLSLLTTCPHVRVCFTFNSKCMTCLVQRG